VSPPLALYALDRPKLQQLSDELRRLLAADDRQALGALLELGAEEPWGAREHAVEIFLVPESVPGAGRAFAALRRIARKRALDHVMTSSDSALEGRMRGFEPLRSQATLARALDRLLNPQRLPWYLRRAGASGGWLGGDERAALVRGMRALGQTLTPELRELLSGLEECDADVILHDGM
jgi:hypothetical protein